MLSCPGSAWSSWILHRVLKRLLQYPASFSPLPSFLKRTTGLDIQSRQQLGAVEERSAHLVPSH